MQAVLSRLRGIKPWEEKWLVVVDNADDLSWNVSDILPKGKAGTFILTSQGSHASRLFTTESIRVDAMQPKEAFGLLPAFFDESTRNEDGCEALLREISERLDRLPLPMYLAGCRILADIEESEDDLKTALYRYLSDFRCRQDELLRNSVYVNASQYDKTVCTVWDTSLASIKRKEVRKPEVYATELLRLLTMFDRSNIQDELFRLASFEIHKAWSWLGIGVPEWMRKLFSRSASGQWDDYVYRRGKGLLLRYGLIRAVNGPWKVVTMHSPVQWRAGIGKDRARYWQWYVTILTVICLQVNRSPGDECFRKHLTAHLPLNCLNDTILGPGAVFEHARHSDWMWGTLAITWSEEGNYELARQLQVMLVESRVNTLGEEDRQTLLAMDNLALALEKQYRWRHANELSCKIIEIRKRVQGERHPETLRSMHRLALTWTIQGRWSDAVNLSETVLRVGKRVLQDDNPATLQCKANLAEIYTEQDRLDKAERLHKEIQKRTLGENHWSVLNSIHNLALVYFEQSRFNEAKELQIKVLEIRSDKLGTNHPDTLICMINLASTYFKQSQLQNAEKLALKSMEISTNVLPENHHIALNCEGIFALVLLKQRRWTDAEELEVKVLEVKSKVLGKRHPDTLDAMGNLAITRRWLGQNDAALTLINRCTSVSAKTLGRDHPCYVESRQIVLGWGGNAEFENECNENASDEADIVGDVGQGPA